MTQINYDDNCPEASGVEQVWSGDVFVGYKVFMDEDNYKSYFEFKTLQSAAADRRREESLESYLREFGVE